MDPTTLLRPGLLDGVAVALGGGDDAFASALRQLGAVTLALPPDADEDALARLLADAPVDVLVHDLRPAFASGGLRAALDGAWRTVRAVATSAFVPEARGGKVALVAPPPDAGDPAAAGVRAAAENLARTLSIEWSRYGVRTTAITPGAGTGADEVAALVAYLASPAGDYFSGCRLALGEAVPA